MTLKEELEARGYSLIRLSAADKKRDPLLKNFKFKTLPLRTGPHGYFKTIDDVREYLTSLKSLEIPV
ncbi:MAG: hypothetical protein ACFFC7_30145 [Candidatus Hermodarchaeota archaeon]